MKLLLITIAFFNAGAWALETEEYWGWAVEDGRLHPSEVAELQAEEIEAWEAELTAEREAKQNKTKRTRSKAQKISQTAKVKKTKSREYGRVRTAWRLDTAAQPHSRLWQLLLWPGWGLELYAQGDTLPQEYYGRWQQQWDWGRSEMWGGYWRWRALPMKWPWNSGWGTTAMAKGNNWHSGLAGMLDSNRTAQLYGWGGWDPWYLAGHISDSAWGLGAGYGQQSNVARVWWQKEQWDIWVRSYEKIPLGSGKLQQRTDFEWESASKIQYKSVVRYDWEAWRAGGQWRWARFAKKDSLRDEFRYNVQLKRQVGDYESYWEWRGLWPSAQYQGLVGRWGAQMPSPWEPLLLGAFQWRAGDSWRQIGVESGIKWRYDHSELSWVVLAPTTAKGLRRFQWRSSYKQTMPWGYISGYWTIQARQLASGELRGWVKF